MNLSIPHLIRIDVKYIGPIGSSSGNLIHEREILVDLSKVQSIISIDITNTERDLCCRKC